MQKDALYFAEERKQCGVVMPAFDRAKDLFLKRFEPAVEGVTAEAAELKSTRAPIQAILDSIARNVFLLAAGATDRHHHMKPRASAESLRKALTKSIIERSASGVPLGPSDWVGILLAAMNSDTLGSALPMTDDLSFPFLRLPLGFSRNVISRGFDARCDDVDVPWPILEMAKFEFGREQSVSATLGHVLLVHLGTSFSIPVEPCLESSPEPGEILSLSSLHHRRSISSLELLTSQLRELFGHFQSF